MRPFAISASWIGAANSRVSRTPPANRPIAHMPARTDGSSSAQVRACPGERDELCTEQRSG